MSTLEATSGFGAHAIYLVAAIPLLVAIVVAYLVWRNARQERSSRTLWTSLADPSPTVRRGALDALTDDTMAHNAPLLCELLAAEQDPDVLDALAAAVARSKWEPTADPALLELRRWVAGGHARTTRSSREPVDSAADPWGGASPSTPVAPAAAGPAVEPAAAPASAPRVDVTAAVAAGLGAATATAATRASGGGEPSAKELEELVPRVRAVLGDELEHVELVSIDGKVLASWSSGENGTTVHGPEVVDT